MAKRYILEETITFRYLFGRGWDHIL